MFKIQSKSLIIDFKEHLIAQRQGRITSHAKTKLFDKHRGEIKLKQKLHNIFKVSRIH